MIYRQHGLQLTRVDEDLQEDGHPRLHGAGVGVGGALRQVVQSALGLDMQQLPTCSWRPE